MSNQAFFDAYVAARKARNEALWAEAQAARRAFPQLYRVDFDYARGRRTGVVLAHEDNPEPMLMVRGKTGATYWIRASQVKSVRGRLIK